MLTLLDILSICIHEVSSWNWACVSMLHVYGHMHTAAIMPVHAAVHSAAHPATAVTTNVLGPWALLLQYVLVQRATKATNACSCRRIPGTCPTLQAHHVVTGSAYSLHTGLPGTATV
jgi:hypothetical protein